MAEKLMTLAECADRLQVSTRTIQRLVASHELSCTHVGGRPRFDEIDIEDYLAGGRDCIHDTDDIKCVMLRAIGRWPTDATLDDLVETLGLKPRAGGYSEEDFQKVKKYCGTLHGEFALLRMDRENRAKPPASTPDPEPQPDPQPERDSYHNPDGTVDVERLMADVSHRRYSTVPRDEHNDPRRARLDQIEAEAGRRGVQPKRKRNT